MSPPSEHDLHAYVDGRLDGERREAVERFLARHPERAAEVAAWQRDAQALRAQLGAANALPDNPALHPAALRARAHRRRRARLSLAAAALACLFVGALGGWHARGMRAETAAAPMSDALEAYRLVVTDGSAAPDLVSRSEGDLQSWLDRHFAQATRLPDLSAAGFHPTGGRLFATDQGAAAMVLYRDADGHAISFYVRPPGPRHRLLPEGQRSDRGLLAQYWSGQGYNYAMVSRDEGADAQVAARARRRAI
ncbi:anti-sigma factor family protein [Dokdonella ginsengisoli]|uniref:Anti-sigma factor family protein n=1 Tax=Dokdonella ginsengisoli TaxID=363846 RepID=A0ABV9QWS9_9GAMM